MSIVGTFSFNEQKPVATLKHKGKSLQYILLSTVAWFHLETPLPSPAAALRRNF